MIDINGMAHVILTVSQFDKAHKFYSGLLPAFGMTKVNDGPDFLYHVGARTAIGVRRCDPQFEAERFEQYRVGLHHICLRAKAARRWIKPLRLRLLLARRSCEAQKSGIGRRAITTCCLKTQTASA